MLCIIWFQYLCSRVKLGIGVSKKAQQRLSKPANASFPPRAQLTSVEAGVPELGGCVM